ncbi:MAG TPA: hypothetical protein VHB21_04035, partial [Minicystis sp.]|nr:hypothetical protein [Minicystis sp.]
MKSALAAVLPALFVAVAWSAGCGGDDTSTGATSSSSSSGSGGGAVDIKPPDSCAFDCGAPCEEPAKPYDCPFLKPWDQTPHDAACGAWDGTYPAPVKGKCTASAPTGEAARKTGPFAGGLVLPDGHRITPAGTEWLFQEADVEGTYPMNVMPLPGTHLVVVSDGGIDDNVLRLVDVDALAAGSDPVAAHVTFHQPSSLFYGLAFVPPSRVLASGGGDGKVYAFDVDTTAKTLARAESSDIDLGVGVDGSSPYYAGPIAVTADGATLLVAPSDKAADVLVVSLAPGAGYGKTLAAIQIGKTATVKTTFDLKRDPFDPAGTTFYLTDIGDDALLEIDAQKKKITRQLTLGKNPAQMVFVDATRMLVSESDHDAVAVVNRASWSVEAHVPIESDKAPHGFSPSALAYDATTHRLYATLAGINAVEAFDVAQNGVPTSAGRIPTAWWPTGVAVEDDGSLVVIDGKGHGTGTDGMQYPWAEGPITRLMHGSIQAIPAASLADLGASTAAVKANLDIASLDGASEVTCPAGADDFPVPRDDAHGPSKIIKHVILVVRENKTYDGVFGDLPGDGDKSLI